MSDHEMTPERLDAILDGREVASDDADRDMLALAGMLRGEAPGASDALRDRIRALPEQPPRRRGLGRRLASGWRSRALVATPALGAVAAAVLLVGTLTGGEDNRDAGADRSSALTESSTTNASGAAATPPAPYAAEDASRDDGSLAATGTRQSLTTPQAKAGPAELRVASRTLPDALRQARAIVARAGGQLVETPQPGSSPNVLLEITLPEETARGALAEVAALGQADVPLTLDAGVGLRVLLVELP